MEPNMSVNNSPNPPFASETRLGQWRKTLSREVVVVPLLILLSLVFMYQDIVFGGHTFLIENYALGTMPSGPYGYQGPGPTNVWHDPGAIAWQIEPWSKLIAQNYQKGRVPFWNPYQGLGVPLHANGMSALFDPISALIYFAPSTWWPSMMDVQLLIRYFIAGIFTYLFMKSVGVKPVGALAAGFIFMYSTYFLDHGNIAYTRVETLLPMVMYAYQCLSTRRSLKAFLFTIFVVFLLILEEFPEILLLQVGLGLAWYTFQSVLIVYRTRVRASVLVKRLGLALMGTLLGIALGAFDILPFIQYLTIGFNIHSIGINPPPWTDPLVLLGINNPGWTSSSAALLSFSLLTLYFRRRNKKVADKSAYLLFFLSTILILLLLYSNFSIFGWFGHNIPILNRIGLYLYPYLEIMFLLACCAGIGLEFFLAVPRLAAIFTAFLFVSTLTGIAISNTSGSNLGVRIVPLLVGFLVIAILVNQNDRGRKLAGFIFVLLLVVEPYTMYVSVSKTRALRYDPYTVPPFVTFLQQQQPFRIVASNGILYPNISSAYQLDDIRYLDAVTPENYQIFRTRFLDVSPTQPPSSNWLTRFDGLTGVLRLDRAIDVLNVKYVLTTSPEPPTRADGLAGTFKLVHNSTNVFVYQNTAAYPRAYVVHQAEVIPDSQVALDRFADPAFDPRRDVILSESLPPETQSVLKANTSQVDPASEPVTVVEPGPNSVILNVTLLQPGMLLLSDLYYPGWEATVDGKAAHIYEANTITRAVYLDAGVHVVEYHYRPPLFFAGLAISGSTVIILVVVIGIYRRRQMLTFRRTSNPVGRLPI